jgi:hypothetical protein
MESKLQNPDNKSGVEETNKSKDGYTRKHCLYKPQDKDIN